MAGLALKEGLTTVWQTMLSDTRARQDGTRRSPWVRDHPSSVGWFCRAVMFDVEPERN